MPPSEDCKNAWIIGYGNDQRCDDGVGPYVIELLNNRLGKEAGIKLAAYHQLQAELAEDLADAKLIIMIDATADPLSPEIQWVRIKPEGDKISHVTHHCRPSFLMGLLELLYEARPPAWLVSVRGEDFSFSSELSPPVRQRAERAAKEIAWFVANQNN